MNFLQLLYRHTVILLVPYFTLMILFLRFSTIENDLPVQKAYGRHYKSLFVLIMLVTSLPSFYFMGGLKGNLTLLIFFLFTQFLATLTDPLISEIDRRLSRVGYVFITIQVLLIKSQTGNTINTNSLNAIVLVIFAVFVTLFVVMLFSSVGPADFRCMAQQVPVMVFFSKVEYFLFFMFLSMVVVSVYQITMQILYVKRLKRDREQGIERKVSRGVKTIKGDGTHRSYVSVPIGHIISLFNLVYCSYFVYSLFVTI